MNTQSVIYGNEDNLDSRLNKIYHLLNEYTDNFEIITMDFIEDYEYNYISMMNFLGNSFSEVLEQLSNSSKFEMVCSFISRLEDSVVLSLEEINNTNLSLYDKLNNSIALAYGILNSSLILGNTNIASAIGILQKNLNSGIDTLSLNVITAIGDLQSALSKNLSSISSYLQTIAALNLVNYLALAQQNSNGYGSSDQIDSFTSINNNIQSIGTATTAAGIGALLLSGITTGGLSLVGFGIAAILVPEVGKLLNNKFNKKEESRHDTMFYSDDVKDIMQVLLNKNASEDEKNTAYDSLLQNVLSPLQTGENIDEEHYIIENPNPLGTGEDTDEEHYIIENPNPLRTGENTDEEHFIIENPNPLGINANIAKKQNYLFDYSFNPIEPTVDSIENPLLQKTNSFKALEPYVNGFADIIRLPQKLELPIELSDVNYDRNNAVDNFDIVQNPIDIEDAEQIKKIVGQSKIINEYTIAPNLSLYGTDVSQTIDIKLIMTKLEEAIREEINRTPEGVYTK